MGMRGFLVVLLALGSSVAPAGAASGPITKDQLVELVAAKVDPGLVRRLVERDCVAFEIDAATLLELSPRVPKELLDAAMSCREARPSSEAPPPCAAAPPAAAVEAAPSPSQAVPYSLNDVQKVAIVPLRLDGALDPALTTAFRDEVLRRGVTFELVDSAALDGKDTFGEVVDGGAAIAGLLPAARAAGAQAVFVGSASTRPVLGKQTVRLEVQLVETDHGRQLWAGDGASQGGSFTLDQRRRIAARNAVKRLPW
jgi:hypothetical protein